MSGICGLINIDNAPVRDAELLAMTRLLGKRGPERAAICNDGSVGLGHTLLATTPELGFEKQPFTHPQSGCRISADVRLDNRDDLLGEHELSARRHAVGDAELILLSYLKWGDACADRLLGDFAFAISDPRQRKLYCARDHSGMRPFYYHFQAGQRLVFASDARAILVLPQVPYQLNQGRIADYLVPQLEWLDLTSTFFDGVHRLPPGHRLVVSPAGLRITEYWKPPAASLQQHDYAEGFLEVLTRAVESRLRLPAGGTGAMLSGGMDSGSVVALAREVRRERGDRPLAIWSAARRPTTDCAESMAVRAAASVPDIDPHIVYPDMLSADHEFLSSDFEEPFDGECMLLKCLYRAGSQQQQVVMLDGGGGDVVLGEGSYIVRLLKQFRLRQAGREIRAKKNFWAGATFWRDLLRYSRAAAMPEILKVRLRPLRQQQRSRQFRRQSLIAPAFADSVDIGHRIAQLGEMFPENWQADYSAERSNAIRPNVTAGRERYARLAAAAGAEAADPFLDKRVIEYSARLPGRARLENGWPKMLLRELMAGRIPDEVRWCPGKPHVGWRFNEAVTRQALQRGELSLDELSARLQGYVDAASLKLAWQQFVDGEDATAIHSARTLAIWLTDAAGRPVVPGHGIG